MELINREAAIDALGEQPMVWTDSDYELGRQNQYGSDVSAIQNAPTIDAVEAVRCKDCKHYINHNCYERNHINIGLFVHDNNYCGWAERRTDECNQQTGCD